MVHNERRSPVGTTRRDLALRLLRDAGSKGVTTGQLLTAGVGSRYSARLRELRERGYVISSECVRPGQWRYTLLREPPRAAAPASPPAPRPRPLAPLQTSLDLWAVS